MSRKSAISLVKKELKEYVEYSNSTPFNIFAYIMSIIGALIFTAILGFLPAYLFLTMMLALSSVTFDANLFFMFEAVIRMIVMVLCIPQFFFLFIDFMNDFSEWKREKDEKK